MHKTARPGGSGGAAKSANRQDKSASRPTSRTPTKSTKSPTTTSKRSISSVGTKKPAPSSSSSRSTSRAKISQHRQGVKATYQSSKSPFSTSSSPSSRSSPSIPSQSRFQTRTTITQPKQQQQKKTGLLNAPLLSQQKASISTLHNNVSSLTPYQQKSIQSKFASIPMVATPTGLQSTHLATPTTLHMNQLRDISTLSTPLQNALKFNKNSTVRSLVTNTPTFTPDIQSLTMNSIDLVPVFTPLPITSQQRTFATKSVTAGAKGGKGGIAAKGKKKDQVEEAEGGEEVFAQAGDVKKNIRNWLEQILTSKPEVYPMPQAAQENEELFVKECQVRFAQRLDKRTRYEQAKIILKQRAIGQLPGELKKHALSEDPALWSMRVITPYSDPPRKKWLMEHFNIPYKASQEEIDTEEFLKKKYARL